MLDAKYVDANFDFGGATAYVTYNNDAGTFGVREINLNNGNVKKTGNFNGSKVLSSTLINDDNGSLFIAQQNDAGHQQLAIVKMNTLTSNELLLAKM